MKKYILISFSLILIGQTFSTPYITPEQWESYHRPAIIGFTPPQIDYENLKSRLHFLTDDQYAYLFEYIQICDFLAQWQVSDTASPDFGGMIEGESGDLVNIIQTDNTQEAIRVWSHYAHETGDLLRFQDNIAAAWLYTMNFPAYSEEGETDYYRVHNCGWALVAQMEYQDVYGDSSFRNYADSCAQYIITHRLSFTQGAPFYQQLHPLVTGWAAGTLYKYGNYTGEQVYVDSAMVLGEAVRLWIEEDPSRLSQNEVWAMSGGTAMWGVVNSVFQEDTVSAIEWLQQYVPYMDVFAGPGEWNNSWNIWYAHAYHDIYNLTADSLHLANAVFLVDTLLFQDTDEDGGIPAGTADPDTMDQTWVSCYTNYMGIEKILSYLPSIDVGIMAFNFPLQNVPVSVNDSLCFSVIPANYGTEPVSTVDVSLNISTLFSASGVGNLSTFGLDTVSLYPYWQPEAAGIYNAIAYTSHPDDPNYENDSLHIEIDVRGDGELFGEIVDASTGDPVGCELFFYHQQVSGDIPLDSTMTDENGFYQIELMAGMYNIEIVPNAPYNVHNYDSIEIVQGEAVEFNASFNAAPILLVDDDGGDWYESYFFTGLDETGFEYYYHSIDDYITFPDLPQLFPIVIWFTGDDDEQTLTWVDKFSLEGFMEGGGYLIITGQNIGDDLGADDLFITIFS